MKRFFDCHNDCLTSKMSDKKIAKYLNSLEDINAILAVWTSRLNAIEAINLMKKAKEISATNSKLLTSFEDLHFLTYENLDLCLNFHPDFAGLVWNEDNCLAGGVKGFNGITTFGESVIHKFEDNNIIIDCAHMNEKSFMQLAKISSKPIYCSHTAFYEFCATPRNLKDYQIKIAVESGGFVGLCFVPELLTGNKYACIDDVVQEILYFVKNYGIDNLGFGSDFYGAKHYPKHLKSYNQLDNLHQKLLKAGFTELEIDKLFFKNFEDFLKRSKL